MKPNWHDVAKLDGFYACTGWTVADLKAVAHDLGMSLGDEQALHLLQKYANRLVDCMVEAGITFLQMMLLEEIDNGS